MQKKQNSQSGAIIIEATISLTAFMFAIIMVLFVSHICYAQAKVGTVIDGVAKDLSEFSYVYSLTGLADKHSKAATQAGQATKSLDSVVDNLSDIVDTVSNLQKVGSDLVNDAEMRSSMLNLLISEGANKVDSILTSVLVKEFAKGRLSGADADCEAVLKNLGIKKTRGTYLDSIDFSDSVFCVNGSAEIKVVARYTVELITLLNVDITFDIVQCAATKAWGAAKKADAEVGKTNETGVSESEDATENVDESEITQIKTPEEYAVLWTHNDESSQVVLGRYADSMQGQSYVMTAIQYNATYFDMADYDEVEAETSADYMWRINKAFLEQQHAKGKQFLLTDDPSKATGTYKQEVLWLQDNGYTFKFDSGVGLWKAVPA